MCPEGSLGSGCQEEWGKGEWDAEGSDTSGINPAWVSASSGNSL